MRIDSGLFAENHVGHIPDLKRRQVNIPIRNQRAAQLRVGSMTEIILWKVQRKGRDNCK